MAFVFKSQKEPQYIQLHPSQIGPGSYNIGPNTPVKTSTAPFGSSSNKNRSISLKNTKDTRPGPGAYQLSSSNNKQKAIPLSKQQEIKLIELPKQSSAFKSNSKRFQAAKTSRAPGPGSYNISIEKKQVINYNKEANRVLGQITNMNRYKSIPSIPGNKQVFGYDQEGTRLLLNKNPFIQFNGTTQDSVGPDRYNPNINSLNKKGASVWAKSKAPKIIQSKLMTKAGPGSYQIQPLAPVIKVKPTSCFVSKTGRSSMDCMSRVQTIDTRRSRLNSQDDQDQDHYDSKLVTPGPGYYNVNKSQKNQKPETKFQFFGSGLKRFGDVQKLAKRCPVGPGQYNVNPTPSKKVISKHVPFNTNDDRFTPQKQVNAGPGAYDVKLSIQKDLVESIKKGYKGSFGSNSIRFKQDLENYEQPGPGEYQYPIKPAKETSNVGHVLKSKSKKETPIKNSQFPGPGEYQIKGPIQLKLQKIKQLNESQGQIAPFGTLAPRFPIQKSEDPDLNLQLIIAQQRMQKERPQKPSGVFKSGTKRSEQTKTITPGPSSYNKQAEWNKRTYNILFTKV